MEEKECFVKDEWLSNILEKSCYNIDLSDNYIPHSEKFYTNAFYTAKIPYNQKNLIKLFLLLGFEFICTEVLFERYRQRDIKFYDKIDFFASCDSKYLDYACYLAGSSFEYSRFHLDIHLEKKANEIKRRWVENWKERSPFAMLFKSSEYKMILGFLLPILQTKYAIIDLICTDSDNRNEGIGRVLVDALNTIAGDRIIRAGTQLENKASVKFYESLGFKIVDHKYVLHYHGN